VIPIGIKQSRSVHSTSVADPDPFDPERDPAFHLNTDPDRTV
jgi:hypothetical protein